MPKRTTNYLTPAEVPLLLGAAGSAAPVLEFALVTGMRSQEIRLLNVGDYQGGGRLLRPVTKERRGKGDARSRRAQSGLRRSDVATWDVDPISDRALACWLAVAGTRPDDAPWLEGAGGKRVGRNWLNCRFREAADAAGIDAGRDVGTRRTFHALRHTFGRTHARAGTDIATLAALMHHESLQTTLLYARAAKEDQARALVSVAFPGG